MRGLTLWVVVALTALSLCWTTVKARRMLRESLGRKIKRGEETSFKTWTEVPGGALDVAIQELDRNPFEGVLRTLSRFSVWRDHGKREDRTLLKRGRP